MTISKIPKLPKTKYSVDNDPPPPKTVCIGVSLITKEVHHIIQDDRHIEIPVDDEVVYLTVNYDVVNLPCGGASYDIIADILDTQGYPRRLWQIMSVWIPVENDLANEIF
ncbi:MAG: hypothetical protein HC939_23450 [Pleurocapsa sp. SU_5_0]|nr:hypothetical protein [Pleurocapsa sp. SU_5_0]